MMSVFYKRNYLLPIIFSSVVFIVGYFGWQKYCDNSVLPTYSKELIFNNVKKNKNIPLVQELFALGEAVKDVVGVKPAGISDLDKRSKLILLNKICKDSCKAIRCRIDPGLGHACRQNCPARKVKFCTMATRRLPNDLPGVEAEINPPHK